MLKKIFSIILVAVMLSNITVFAQLSENDGVYSEDFEGYETGADIMTDKTIINEFTKLEPELLENNGSQAMVVNSAKGVENLIFTNPDLYVNELNVIKFKMGADSSSKLNWGSASSLMFSHTNDTGIMVNDYIFDFAYSLVRHKENGVSEKAICGFTSKKMYDVEIKVTKQQRDEKYYYDVTYIVEGSENLVSFPTTIDGTMRIGFKSTEGNKVYVDDITVYGFTLVKANANVAEREDVSVIPQIEISFSDAVDETTLIPENIYVGSVSAKEVKNIGANKYILTLKEPLLKNTEYTFDLSCVKDTKGNSVANGDLGFKTRNTSIVIVEGEVVNTSKTDSENVLIAVPIYNKDGSMVNNSIVSIEVFPEEEIAVGSKNYIVLTDDFKPVESTFILNNTGAFNDEFCSEFDSSTQTVHIAGKTVSGVKDELVSITVTNAEGVEDYIGFVETDEDGYFSVEYTPISASGMYNVTAKTMSEEFVSSVRIVLTSDIKGLLEIVNTKNAKEISDALEIYKDAISIDLDLYHKLPDKNFISVEIEKADKYETIEQLIDDINALSVIDTIRSVENMYQIFADCEYVILSETAEAYEVWKELGDSEKNEVLKEMIADEVYSPAKFKQEIYLRSVFKLIESTNKYIDVKNVIEKYPELLKLDLSEYNIAGKPASVAKGLCGKKWDIDSFGKKFNNLVNDAINDTSDKQGGSGGSGGSGGGGGGFAGNIETPKSTPEPMNTPKPTLVPEDEYTDFTDMNDVEWAQEAVDSLCKKNILRGYEDGTFRPNEKITREEFVAIIVRYLGIDGNVKCEFEDVSGNDWFYNSVALAAQKGIINGISETEFGTGRNITRQDAAVVLYNIGGLQGNDELKFTDMNEIAEYALESVTVLSSNGIINGNPDGSFEPFGLLTRAQAAQMIYTYELIKEGT